MKKFLWLLLLPAFVSAELPARVECLEYGNALFWPESQFESPIDVIEFEEAERDLTTFDFIEGAISYESQEGKLLTYPVKEVSPEVYLSVIENTKDPSVIFNEVYVFNADYTRLVFASGGDIAAFYVCKRFKR